MSDDLFFRPDCPSRAIIDEIANKWSILILAVLLDEPRRFNDIKRRLEGITQRVLTQNLRRLERNGMITRRVLSGRTLGVEYALTPLGRSLQEPLGQVYDWAVRHMDVVQSRQRAYDERFERGESIV